MCLRTGSTGLVTWVAKLVALTCMRKKYTATLLEWLLDVCQELLAFARSELEVASPGLCCMLLFLNYRV